MSTWIEALVPFASVLIGGGLTYFLNVRQRRRNAVEDLFVQAAIAVSLAEAAINYLAEVSSQQLTDPDRQALARELTMEGNRNFAHREHEARDALARASVYEPSLRMYCVGESTNISKRAAEILSAIRSTRHGAAALSGTQVN